MGKQMPIDSADSTRLKSDTATDIGEKVLRWFAQIGAAVIKPTKCQRRSKNASAGRSKNTSAMLARRPPNWGPFVSHQTWAGLSAGVSELARRERLLL